MSSNQPGDQDPRDPIVDGNIQGLVPQVQADPPLQPNDHYLPNGSLTVHSEYNYATKEVSNVTITPMTLRRLFVQKFDSTEQNFANTAQFPITLEIKNPLPYALMPNIANWIGHVICGTSLNDKFIDALIICTRNYLEGTMEILPNGSFSVLTTRRPGLTRRYSKLCIFVHFALAATHSKVVNHSTINIRNIQAIMQDIYGSNRFTSVYTSLEPYNHLGNLHHIATDTIKMWATRTPWHALIYNSQTPMLTNGFRDLFFKIYSLCRGAILRNNANHSNDQKSHSIIPNSPFFTNVVPAGMIAHVRHIPEQEPFAFVNFMRYFLASDEGALEWDFDDDDDDEVNSENNNTGSESVDESQIS